MITILLLAILPLAFRAAANGTPITPCIVGGTPCETGYTCTQTMTCGGLCLTTTPNGSLPTQACILGGSQCPEGSICTQTEVCSGECIATSIAPSLVSCIVGGGPCPTGSTCTQTMTCGGLCLTTAPNGGLPTQPCVLGGSPCPVGAICTQTETCQGLCIASATTPPTSSSTHSRCHGHDYGRHDRHCTSYY